MNIHEQVKSFSESEFLSDTDKNKCDEILKNIEDLIGQDLPPIIDIYSFADFSKTDIRVIASTLKYPAGLYRKFTIPKKNGTDRLIEAPIPQLLSCQQWICLNLLERIELHNSATAYRKNIGLLENIKPHLGQKHLLKLDLKDFFHSIKIERVISVFKKFGYSKEVAYILASICCVENRLSQGAATSPILSNTIAKRLDYRLDGLAKKYNLDYTRYSDDITFSGQHIHKSIVKIIGDIVSDEGFSINQKKTRLYIEKGKRIITGISVSEETPKLPRETKRKIRQDFYEIIKMGNLQEVIESTFKDVFFMDSLKGKLYFWKYIEKDALFPIKALEILKEFENKE